MSTVGDALSQLSSSVNAFVEKQNKDLKGPRSTEIELATDVSIAIGNAHTAWTYSGELTKLESTVDSQMQARLAALRGLVEVLGSQEAISLANLSPHVQRFTESLSLSSWQPKLKGIFSRYVFVHHNNPANPQYWFDVSFHGNFECAGKNLKGCSLSFPDFEDPKISVQHTTDTLTFRIDGLKREFFSQIPAEGCKFVKGVLTVQYDAGTFRSDIKQAVYGIWIGIYPLKPGQISLTYPVEKVVEVKEQPFRSPAMSLAQSHLPKDGPRERKIALYPTPGWKIKVTDEMPQLFCNGVSSIIGQEHFNENRINVTLALPEGQEQADFYVTCSEIKEVRELRDHTEQVDLEWGSFHPINSNKFGVKFNSFDGQRFEFTSEDKKIIPYLKVRHFAGRAELVAEIPKKG